MNVESPPIDAIIPFGRSGLVYITKSVMKIKELGDEINELRHGFGEIVARVAKAVGVEHALNQPLEATPAATII